MEDNIKRTIHIEFYGLPGSGKSTISHILAENLKEENEKLKEPSYDIFYNISKFQRLFKKILFLILLLFRNPVSYFKLYNIVKENGYFKLEHFKQMSNIAYKIYLYKHSRKNNIYIWDEGIVQSAISLSMFNKTTALDNLKKIENIIDKNSYTMKKIFIKVPIELSIERLNNRQIKHSRVEKFSDNEITTILKNIANNVNKFNSDYIIETNECNENIINDVKKYIKNLKK